MVLVYLTKGVPLGGNSDQTSLWVVILGLVPREAQVSTAITGSSPSNGNVSLILDFKLQEK